MKKFLRFIGVLLLIVVAGVVILGLVAPKDISSERSVVINAPKERVMAHMFRFENFNTFNPFKDLDSNMTSEVTGEDGRPGAKYSWKGEKTGSGEMVTKAISEDEMKYDMQFKEPMESKANGYWKVVDAGNGSSKVTWGFNTHIGFPWNGLMMVAGMKKGLEKDFDKGLNRLKTYIESHPEAGGSASAYDIKEAQFAGSTYAAIRQKVSTDMNPMMKFFDESYQKLGQAAGNRINGYATCLAYGWDEQNGQADLAPAFPVSGTEPVAGATMVTVQPTPALMTVHTGGYSSMMAAHEAIGRKLGAEPGLVVEEYVKGPGEERDSTKWVTNIYYLRK